MTRRTIHHEDAQTVHTAEFKAKVALEAIQGQRTITELATPARVASEPDHAVEAANDREAGEGLRRQGLWVQANRDAEGHRVPLRTGEDLKPVCQLFRFRRSPFDRSGAADLLLQQQDTIEERLGRRRAGVFSPTGLHPLVAWARPVVWLDVLLLLPSLQWHPAPRLGCRLWFRAAHDLCLRMDGGNGEHGADCCSLDRA